MIIKVESLTEKHRQRELQKISLKWEFQAEEKLSMFRFACYRKK